MRKQIKPTISLIIFLLSLSEGFSGILEELDNKSLLEFIIKQSQHTNKKIDPRLKSKFDLESNESHKKYLINQKEDNIDFESFLEGFRGEIK